MRQTYNNIQQTRTHLVAHTMLQLPCATDKCRVRTSGGGLHAQDKPSQAKRQRQDKRRQDNIRQDNIRQDKRRQENTSQGKTIRNSCRLGQSSLFSSLQIGSLEFHGTIVVFLIDISFCLCAEETIG